MSRGNIMKKTISFVIPTYNEEENVSLLVEGITTIMKTELLEYDYEIIFADNHSTDRTREVIRALCSENKNIKAIFNARNFGLFRSPIYGLKQALGDCVIRMCADFQDPLEMIVTFVREWEKGYKIVIGVKKSSQENKIVYWLRTCYYKLSSKLMDIDHIEHFTGFGLYDKRFVDVIRDLSDPLPYFRGIVAELGFDYKMISYEQPRRRAGKSKNNWSRLYEYAMVGLVSYAKKWPKAMFFAGFGVGVADIIFTLACLWRHAFCWDAGIFMLVLFLMAMQLFFMGIIGEYLIGLNTRILNRPLVVEEERINF